MLCPQFWSMMYVQHSCCDEDKNSNRFRFRLRGNPMSPYMYTHYNDMCEHKYIHQWSGRSELPSHTIRYTILKYTNSEDKIYALISGHIPELSFHPSISLSLSLLVTSCYLHLYLFSLSLLLNSTFNSASLSSSQLFKSFFHSFIYLFTIQFLICIYVHPSSHFSLLFLPHKSM